jgi:adenine-specific DNA methylase
MKVWITQFYLNAATSFPFTHTMQIFMAGELSAVAEKCEAFQARYGEAFELTVYINSEADLLENRILGPTVFKKTKDVEYTLTLPFDVIAKAPDGCRGAMEFLVAGVRAVFQKAGIDPAKLDERTSFIIDRVCSDSSMLKEPWPTGRRTSGALH